jgi:alkylhydroperoxidase family enzyme
LAPHRLSEELYAHVAQWQTYPDYTDAERVAIEYTEKFATDHKKLDDAFFARMREHFSDEEILEISVCVGNWLMMGRITMVMDVNTSCPIRLPLEEPEA